MLNHLRTSTLAHIPALQDLFTAAKFLWDSKMSRYTAGSQPRTLTELVNNGEAMRYWSKLANAVRKRNYSGRGRRGP